MRNLKCNFETELANGVKLYLKPTTAEDYDDYYIIRCSQGDVYWNGYLSAPDKESFRKLFLERLGDAKFELPEDRRLYLICVRMENNDNSVGFLQLIKRKDGIDISYTVTEAYQKHGYATEALRLGIRLAKQFGDCIYVQIRDDNIASQHVARKCNFVRTEEYTEHEYPMAGRVKLRKYRLLKFINADLKNIIETT